MNTSVTLNYGRVGDDVRVCLSVCLSVSSSQQYGYLCTYRGIVHSVGVGIIIYAWDGQERCNVEEILKSC